MTERKDTPPILNLAGAGEDEHWCGWCAEHPERGYSADKSAITDCVLIGTTETFAYGDPHGAALHIHGATVVGPGELTLRGTLRRLYRNKRNQFRFRWPS